MAVDRKITPVDGELGDLLHKTMTTEFCAGFIKVDGCILPQYYPKYADAIENFEIRDDDVWVCGFLKTGTTWTQEMIWSIVNDLDSEQGKVPMSKRFPLLERSIMLDTDKFLERNPVGTELSDFAVNSLDYAASMPSPRLIKTHLPINLLPRQLRNGEKNAKIVYVYRNAKDTCISFYHFNKLLMGFSGSFDDHCNLFVGDTVYYGPFWKHVTGFWNRRNDSNILLLKYEDMKQDLPSVIKKTAKFIGKNLTTDRLSLLLEHLSFSSMKTNPGVNREGTILLAKKVLQHNNEGKFIRSGESEQWKTAMNPEVIKRFDDWTKEHLNGTGLSL